MNKIIVFKKLGNHWYPDVNHDHNYEIAIDVKIEKYFNILSHFNSITVELEEIPFVNGHNILYLNESDIIDYLSTDFNILINFRIDNKRFKISADLFTLLNAEYNLDLINTLYKIKVWYLN